RAREAHQPRVPRPVVSDAPPRTRRLPERTDRAHLRAERRPRFEYGRGVRRAAAPQARGVADRDRSRSRLPHGGRPVMTLSLRARVLIGAALWTIGLLTVTSVVGIAVLLGHPIEHAFLLHVFFTHPGESLAVAVVCLALGFWQVRKGLSTLDHLRAG